MGLHYAQFSKLEDSCEDPPVQLLFDQGKGQRQKQVIIFSGMYQKWKSPPERFYSYRAESSFSLLNPLGYDAQNAWLFKNRNKYLQYAEDNNLHCNLSPACRRATHFICELSVQSLLLAGHFLYNP